jgi:hypothetical protein
MVSSFPRVTSDLSPEQMSCFERFTGDLSDLSGDPAATAAAIEAFAAALASATPPSWGSSVRAVRALLRTSSRPASTAARRHLAQFVAENADLLSA